MDGFQKQASQGDVLEFIYDHRPFPRPEFVMQAPDEQPRIAEGRIGEVQIRSNIDHLSSAGFQNKNKIFLLYYHCFSCIIVFLLSSP